MSKELAKTYDPKGLEERLYQKWLDNKYFHAEVNRDKKPFTIVMPPPNVTGQLHMGHALDETMQDILIRFKRMQGYEALWQPGFCVPTITDGKYTSHGYFPASACKSYQNVPERKSGCHPVMS